ncbi:hypothetical protein MMC20_004974 [Loxospora ochrophaea]|nr:hypothetical protein [Loxospora ochrophaea]
MFTSAHRLASLASSALDGNTRCTFVGPPPARFMVSMIYAFGSNGSGQLGIGNQADTSAPSPCKFNGDWAEEAGIPLKITAGGNHSLILFSSGSVYASGGTPKHLQISLSDTAEPSLIYSKIEALGSKIKFCSATWEASVLVAEDDQIYTLGKGQKGELGQGSAMTSIDRIHKPLMLPSEISNGTAITALASGVDHTVVVFSTGEVYGWGNGRKGQLGKPAEIVWKPRKIEGLDFKVIGATCGRDFTYLLGDSKQGHHTLLGSDKWGVKSDAPSAALNWKQAGASWGSIFVLEESGKIISWGRNDHGQLASNGLPDTTNIGVGSEHVIALGRTGNVFAWGWGEHGNCGSGIDNAGDVKGRWNEITLPDINKPQAVIGLGAGCATSWFWTE